MGNQLARGSVPLNVQREHHECAGDAGVDNLSKRQAQKSKAPKVNKPRKPRMPRKTPNKSAKSSLVELNKIRSLFSDNNMPVMLALVATDTNGRLRIGNKHLQRCCSQNYYKKPCIEQQVCRRVRSFPCANYCYECEMKSVKASKRSLVSKSIQL